MMKMMFISIFLKKIIKNLKKQILGGVEISIGDVETAIQDEFLANLGYEKVDKMILFQKSMWAPWGGPMGLRSFGSNLC